MSYKRQVRKLNVENWTKNNEFLYFPRHEEF